MRLRWRANSKGSESLPSLSEMPLSDSDSVPDEGLISNTTTVTEEEEEEKGVLR